MSCTGTQNWDRSLKLYGFHNILSNAFFWTPVFILYFSQIVSLKEIFLLEAIYYAGVFLMEVPSGYFSDRLGRRRTLILSGLFFVIAYALFFIGGGFTVLAAAQLFLAGGFSFASGTDTSLHFALLSILNREEEYGVRESRLASAALYVSAGASAAGGLMAWIGAYRWAYALSFAFAAVFLILAIVMRDPESECPGENQKALPPLKQLKSVTVHLKQPRLRFLFLFTVFITVLNHVPYEFYQLYIEKFFSGLIGASEDLPTPLITGAHATLTLLISAFLARRSMAIRKRTGTRGLLLGLTALQGLIIGSLMIIGRAEVIILLLLRGLPGALSAPAVREQTSPRLPAGLRATYFSMQSLMGRAAFSLTLLGFRFIPGDGYGGSLITATAGAFLFLLILIPLSREVRD